MNIIFLFFQISFLLPLNAIPGRMGLLFSLLLCLVNIFNSTIYAAPKNAVGITHWILSCILFIVLAILEYALLIAYKKYKKAGKIAGNNRMSKLRSGDDESIEKLSKQMDRSMILILPPVFCVFGLLFWVN